MKKTPKTIILIVLLLLIGTLVHAQGILIPEPPPPDIRRHPIPIIIRTHQVQVTIENQVASTTVKQVFENKSRVDLEGIYIFPVPTGASITEFSMWMNGEKVSGEVVEAQRARRIYEDIVRRMKDPGLLEYLGQDMFRARVYPIPGRGEVQIEIVYEEVLELDSGLIGYAYPLHTENCRPRSLGSFAIDVQIKSDAPIKNLYSPTFDIDREITGTTASCSYESDNFISDNDFLLYYTVAHEDVGLTLMTHPPRRFRRGDDSGYFMLLLSPGKPNQPRKTPGKDIIFVVDRSGSMKGEKIEQAKEAARFCLQSLNEKDRFNIVTFSTNVESFSEGLVYNTKDGTKRALRFVDRIKARGGTDINEALLGALNVGPSKRPQIVIFITDGAPTVGETNVGRILENIADANRGNVRIFVFGVGYDVNTLLLDKLATENRGTVEYVKPEENIEVKISNFYSKVSHPVMSDISLGFGKVRVFDVFPRDLPDLFDGSQLVVLGRYEGGGATSIVLTGNVGEREVEQVYDAHFGASRYRDRYDFIPRLWASRTIAYLMEEIRMHGAKRELVDEVIELSLEFGIVTPYTSYLILEDERPRWRHVRPLFEKLAPEARGVAEGMARTSGADAVGLSKMIVGAKDKSTIEEPSGEGVRFVAGKAFYLSDGVWTDSEYEEDSSLVEVEFMSDEYFDLLQKAPGIAKYLALGEEVIFVHDGVAYKVTSD
ncbi:MAG: VWA domain-containing protein [Candidatus Latescibacterota bacterium]|nr:MAG: VWA domain-containing protein [Candidatus Latescibacterota bacterium]